MVQLTDELVELLDRRATHDGVSRSQVIRTAIEAYLGEDRQREIDRQIIEGYRRIPPDTPDEWGDVGAWHDAIARANLRAGQAEES